MMMAATASQIHLEDVDVRDTKVDKVSFDRAPSIQSQNVALQSSMSSADAPQPQFIEHDHNAPPTVVTDPLPTILESGLIPVEEQHSTLEPVDTPKTTNTPPTPHSPAPTYEQFPSPNSFNPSVHLQIQTGGKGWLAAPLLRLHPDPIPVFAVEKNSSAWTTDLRPKYLSLRNNRESDNSVLVPGDDTDRSVLGSVFFGFSKPPQLRIYSSHPAAGKSPYTAFREIDVELRDKSKYPMASSFEEEEVQHANGGTPPSKTGTWTAKLESKSWASRALHFTTPYGDFEWRYGERSERKDWDAESLIILDRIQRPQTPRPDCGASVHSSSTYWSSSSGSTSGKKGRKKDELRTTVGYYGRNDAFRTPGTRTHTAGNGGRLMLDLSDWENPDAIAHEKPKNFVDDKAKHLLEPVNEAEEVEKVAVISLISLLHKEVERRRIHQAVIIF